MRYMRNSVSVLAAIMLSGAAVAATSNKLPEPAKPAKVAQTATPGYADTSAAQTNAAHAIPVDVNTNVPYASVLPKDAEIVPGAPGKNEFFIVAAEDAAKIKHLIDHTKPGREIAANDIKSKQPIVKVKLDENNSSLVSMDVVNSVNTVAKAAIKPSVHMTENDEVLSIFTKNKITPVGSRAVAVRAPIKEKVMPDEVDEKPMLKLLAANDETRVPATATQASDSNPLLPTAAAKPGNKVVMPDTVAVGETIQQPLDKPVDLPPASKDAAPTLEMVLQAVTKTVATKSTSTKMSTKKLAAKKGSANMTVARKRAMNRKPTMVAGKIIPYEQIKPMVKKGPWNARHSAAIKKTTTKKVATKGATKGATKKRILNVGVVHSYSDYLTQTGHRTGHHTE